MDFESNETVAGTAKTDDSRLLDFVTESTPSSLAAEIDDLSTTEERSAPQESVPFRSAPTDYRRRPLNRLERLRKNLRRRAEIRKARQQKKNAAKSNFANAAIPMLPRSSLSIFSANRHELRMKLLNRRKEAFRKQARRRTQAKKRFEFLRAGSKNQSNTQLQTLKPLKPILSMESAVPHVGDEKAGTVNSVGEMKRNGPQVPLPENRKSSSFMRIHRCRPPRSRVRRRRIGLRPRNQPSHSTVKIQRNRTRRNHVSRRRWEAGDIVTAFSTLTQRKSSRTSGPVPS